MTQAEAIDEVAYLKGLFPMTTETRMLFWVENFIPRDRDAVRRALRRFAEKHGDFADPAGLITLIDDETRRGVQPRNPQLERAKIDDQWKRIDDTLGSIPPADLERLQADAIDSLPEGLRAGCRRRGLSDVVVKSKIYAVVTAAHG